MRSTHETIQLCYLVPGQTWPVELGWLLHNLQQSRFHAEIGTFCGRSLLASCGGMRKRAKVFSIDNQSEWTNREWVKSVQDATLKLIETAQVTVINANSTDACRSLEPEWRGKLDSVFIDGCHEYAECKADIQAWMPLIRPGGLICGHDYWSQHVGVMDAVNEVFHGKHDVASGTRIWFSRV